jgi:hypothetical protein
VLLLVLASALLRLRLSNALTAGTAVVEGVWASGIPYIATHDGGDCDSRRLS